MALESGVAVLCSVCPGKHGLTTLDVTQSHQLTGEERGELLAMWATRHAWWGVCWLLF